MNLNLMKLRIIWAALLGSHFVYGGALYYTISSSPEGGGVTNEFLYGIMGMSALMYGVGYFVPKFLMNSLKKTNPQDMDDMIHQFTTPMIIRLASFEGAAMGAFAVSFLAKDMKYFLPYIAVNTVLFLMNLPSEGRIKHAFRA